MKLAIMQPYFFPYLGYWQLLHACDRFVILDDVQFIRHGWIERNRVLDPNGEWQYVSVQLQKHSHTERIRNVRARDDSWKTKLFAQLAHYKRRAPHFAEVDEVVHSIVDPIGESAIARIDAAIIRSLCGVLGVERDIRIASECALDYASVAGPGDWALCIAAQMGASEYFNPVSGAPLFDAARFVDAGIQLGFLEPEKIEYDRRGPFVPNLSIIDVLMFNGIAGTTSLLGRYAIKYESAA